MAWVGGGVSEWVGEWVGEWVRAGWLGLRAYWRSRGRAGSSCGYEWEWGGRASERVGRGVEEGRVGE